MCDEPKREGEREAVRFGAALEVQLASFGIRVGQRGTTMLVLWSWIVSKTDRKKKGNERNEKGTQDGKKGK